MRGLPAISSTETFRVRRWDAVILGGALPGLIAASRLARRGCRVLVLEEAGAARGFAGLREPFLVTGAEPEGVLGTCFEALGIPLIERRRFAAEEIALQVAMPDARVDIGLLQRTADELTAWGLAKPEPARALLLALETAARAEREAMLRSPIVRRGVRPTAPAPGRPGSGTDGGERSRATRRGLPAELGAASEPVRRMFGAALRALSNLGAAPPSDAASARLLGGLLAGGTVQGGTDGWLRGLMRRRAESLFTEFREVDGPIRFVSVAGQPGVAVGGSDEIWAGRALVLNAPRAALADALDQSPVPAFLDVPPVRRRRVWMHWRAARGLLPECMSDRVVCTPDPAASTGRIGAVALRVFRGAAGRDRVDLLASTVGPMETDGSGADTKRMEAQIEATVRTLLPLAGDGLERIPVVEPLWDSDSLLADPQGDETWPAEVDLRLTSRPAVYALDRAWVGGLGFEGDVLLGWRGGDAIAGELA